MNISKRQLIVIFGCVLLLLYLLVAVGWSRFMASGEVCKGLDQGRVQVIDPQGVGFVTPEEITAFIAASTDSLQGRPFTELNLAELQRSLRESDQLEWAEVTRLADNTVRVRVWPMKPVARIWPPSGRSYYVNREGKRIMAEPRFRLDVAQVTGRFDSLHSETSLLPLLRELAVDPKFERMITMIDASDTTNIILVPAIRGHVINIGTADDAQLKLARLRRFYREVLPVKGWEFYDTISLKWKGQIVATRRHGKMPDITVPIIEELENEGDDQATMEVN